MTFLPWAGARRCHSVRAAAIFCALLASGCAVDTATESRSIALSLSARVAFEPASLRVKITVEPQADQRLLIVQADSATGYRRSDVQLEGLGGPRTQWVEWRDLGAGDYEVSASVATQREIVARASQKLQILSRTAE